MSWFLKNRIPLLVIVVVGSILYATNLNNPLFWDDDDWIVNNPRVHELSWENAKSWFTENALAGIGGTSNYYRPVLFASFALNYVVGEKNPLGYHLVNNFFHIANAVLVFYLLNAVLRRRDQKFSVVAFLVALVFVLHPLQTEAVSYIAGRGDPMGAFFMLGALALWFGAERRLLPWHHGFRIASLASLMLAILTRETAIIFPALLVLFYLSFLSQERFGRGIITALKKASPYVGLVLIYGLLRLSVLNFDNTLNFYSVQNVYSENLAVRLFTFMHVLWVYLRLLLWPAGLHMERSVPVHLSLGDLEVWSMVAVLIVIGAWLLYLYRSGNHRHELSAFRVALFGLGWFAISIFPFSGVTPINALLYEHWLYMPMVGFFALLVSVLVWIWERLPTIEYRRAYLAVAGLLGLGFTTFFVVQTISRNLLWGDALAFYEDILTYEPRNVKINNNVANIYSQRGNVERAVHYYQQAIQANDVFPQPYYNLGTIVEAQGDLPRAAALYQQAIERDPRFYFAYARLVTVQTTVGQYQGALDTIERMKNIYPDDPALYYNAAILHSVLKDVPAAQASLQAGWKYATEPSIQARFVDLLKQLQP